MNRLAWTKHLWRSGLMVCLCLLPGNCGVEVGNPADETPTGTGTGKNVLSIEIADAPVDDAAHLYLNIEGIYLVVESGRLYPLDLAVREPVDVLSLQDGLTEVLVREQSVPAGDYRGFLILLNQKRPARVVLKEGGWRPVFLPGEKHKYVRVPSAFTLGEGQEGIILHLDLRRSLLEVNGRYVLDPMINPLRRRNAAVLVGNAGSGVRGLVCAFLEDTPASEGDARPGMDDLSLIAGGRTVTSGRERAPQPPAGGFDPPPPDSDRHDSRGPGRKPRPPAGQGGEVCGNAFAGVPVRQDGSFSLHFLEEGTWSLRLLTSDGEVLDSVETWALGPGEKVDAGAVRFTAR